MLHPDGDREPLKGSQQEEGRIIRCALTQTTSGLEKDSMPRGRASKKEVVVGSGAFERP